MKTNLSTPRLRWKISKLLNIFTRGRAFHSRAAFFARLQKKRSCGHIFKKMLDKYALIRYTDAVSQKWNRAP